MGARSDLKTCEPEMDCAHSDRETVCVEHAAVAMVTPDEHSPSASEGVPGCQSPKLPVLRGSLRGSHLYSFKNIDYKRDRELPKTHTAPQGESRMARETLKRGSFRTVSRVPKRQLRGLGFATLFTQS